MILPACLKTVAGKENLCIPYFMAKSLGSTGRSWDKLNTIPGFKYFEENEGIKDALIKNDVTMAAIGEGFDRLDRELYPFRAVTGTVDSMPLIVMRIASKQLAFPVDYLLIEIPPPLKI